MRYDIVIVGGGSAGCALANRLSADGSTRVLVLEAGRPDYAWDVYIHMPAALSFPIGNRFYDWRYESEPEPHMNGRRIYHARGKVLGGSSSINGMIFQRGNPLEPVVAPETMILPPGSSSSRVPIVEPITDSCRKNAVVGVLAALVVLRPSALRALGSGPRHGGLGLRLPAVLQADGYLHGGRRHLGGSAG